MGFLFTFEFTTNTHLIVVKLSMHSLTLFFLATISKVFELDGGNFQYVFNLAAITKYSQPEEVIN